MLFLLMIEIYCSAINTNDNRHEDYSIHAVPFTSVNVMDTFWSTRMKINQEVTIPVSLKHCYKTGRVDNFKKAGRLMKGYFGTKLSFDDTDIYKIIEGISYSIQNFPNKMLETEMDTLIYYISKAQEQDGYLCTARTAAEPGKMQSFLGKERWTRDPIFSHELYNCGHLYEAAVAHYQGTGKRTLLDVAIKNADLLVKEFGPGKLIYEPGHQIVEMGLVKMYRVTGKKEYLDLAHFFLDVRGREGKGREETQSQKPVAEQDEAVGHAVRAGYMYSGMADVAVLTGNKLYANAIDRIWENVVYKKLYITGGLGSVPKLESFGAGYDLPNSDGYCETCAAIASVYWNHRMFLMHGEAKYYDVLERTLYNGLISGIGLSGDRFFYANRLESSGGYTRSGWFPCPCCVSNVCRFMPSVPGYVYAQGGKDIYVNLFVSSRTTIEVNTQSVTLTQETNYPWEGNVLIKVQTQRGEFFTLRLRVPGWVLGKPVPGDLYTYSNPKPAKIELKINGQKEETKIGSDGYIALPRMWKSGDEIEMSLPMEVNLVLANEKVRQDNGRVSIERGPLCYCLESLDNTGDVLKCVIGLHSSFSGVFLPNKLNGIYELQVKGKTIKCNEANSSTSTEDTILTAIPYYAWANREKSTMVVWVPTSVAEIGSCADAGWQKEKISSEHIQLSPSSLFSPSIMEKMGKKERVSHLEKRNELTKKKRRKRNQ